MHRTGIQSANIMCASYLSLESAETTAMDDLRGHSITYRIAMGPRQGRKAFTLQILPARADERIDPSYREAEIRVVLVGEA